MSIAVSTISGCCVANNFFNLGGAHGYVTARDQDEFDKWLYEKHGSTVNIALTNSQQAKTRSFLEGAGWKTEKVDKTSIWISTISGADFQAFKAKIKARLLEVQKNKLEEARRIEEERQKRIQGTKFGLKIASKTFEGKVTLAQVCHLSNNLIPMTNEDRAQIAINLNNYYRIRMTALDIPYSSRPLTRITNAAEHLRDRVYRKVKAARDSELAKLV